MNGTALIVEAIPYWDSPEKLYQISSTTCGWLSHSPPD